MANALRDEFVRSVRGAMLNRVDDLTRLGSSVVHLGEVCPPQAVGRLRVPMEFVHKLDRARPHHHIPTNHRELSRLEPTQPFKESTLTQQSTQSTNMSGAAYPD